MNILIARVPLSAKDSLTPLVTPESSSTDCMKQQLFTRYSMKLPTLFQSSFHEWGSYIFNSYPVLLKSSWMKQQKFIRSGSVFPSLFTLLSEVYKDHAFQDSLLTKILCFDVKLLPRQIVGLTVDHDCLVSALLLFEEPSEGAAKIIHVIFFFFALDLHRSDKPGTCLTYTTPIHLTWELFLTNSF